MYAMLIPADILTILLAAAAVMIVIRTARDIMAGRWASDLIATIAIVAALVLHQPIAGLIIVLMLTGGEALERYAEGKASAAVRALEADRPQQAHVVRAGQVSDIPARDVHVDDVLIVRPGELIPCDGVVIQGSSEIDTSRLTGEPVPVPIKPESTVGSGSVNGMRMFTMRATALARDSQYDKIVELVRSAQQTKAPFQRLADQYATWFTPLTLIVAAAAGWFREDWTTVLAVLVVATPCPLILAPPIAIIGGMNRAARRHIIVRTGGAMERLAKVDVAVFDKTGTLTIGKPVVSDIFAYEPFTRTQLLQLAASVEQGATHLLARTVVDAATAAHITLLPVFEATEEPGRGIVGCVEHRSVAVGSARFIAERLNDPDHLPSHRTRDGLNAYVAIDGELAGIIAYADQLRPGITQTLAELHHLGFRRMVLLSGDHSANARAIAMAVGIDEARGDLSPAEKVAVVQELAQQGLHVLMIGDGTNDAPALSSAAVGIALAAHGGGVTAEAADVVLLVDDVSRIPEVIQLSRRTMRIARQSVVAGLALSGIAMGVAAAGYLPPIAGALLQEVIDVAVIVNALRAPRIPST